MKRDLDPPSRTPVQWLLFILLWVLRILLFLLVHVLPLAWEHAPRSWKAWITRRLGLLLRRLGLVVQDLGLWLSVQGNNLAAMDMTCACGAPQGVHLGGCNGVLSSKDERGAS